jgi:hypothetical protein
MFQNFSGLLLPPPPPPPAPLGEHAARIAATLTPPATPKNPRRVKLAPFCDGIVASF